MELPPLRTLDDFLLGSARFQLPSLKDLEKWSNRVVKNLLYYQTNYFLMSFSVYALLVILNPVKVVCGLSVQAMLLTIVMQFFQKNSTKATLVSRKTNSNASAESPQQKWYYLAGVMLFGYLLLYWFEAILFAMFTLLLPISLTFIHASLRLRNIKNKVANTIESFGPSTPMGAFLDSINITADNILN